MKRTFKWSTLKHLLCAGVVLVQCMVSAAVLQWTAEVAQPLPYDAQLFQGETMEFCAKLVNYGAPLTSAGTATFYYQSPDMGETEWYTSPVTWEPATGTARLTWTPAMDAGAKRYRFFIGLTTADGTLYRVYGSIQMRASPGFSPGTPIPQDSLAKVEQWLKECRDLVAAAETARTEEDAALLEKIEALETVDEAVAEALIGKAEVEHEHPQYLTALPEGLVTQAEVTEALAQKAAVDHTHEALEARVEALEGATGDSAEVGEVRSALANEVVAREAGDSALSGRVATVESRISIVESNQSDLKQKADAEALTAEVSARQAGDAALEQALALETAQRQTQLTALANAVNSKASATHGHAMAEVAGLEDALAARALQTQADALEERVGALEATAGASAEVGEVRSALADEVRAREAGDSALSGRVTTVESRINIVENNVAEIRGNVETAVTTVANAVQAAETAERRSEAYEAAAEEALQTVTQLSGKLDERLDNFGAEVAESAAEAVEGLSETLITSIEEITLAQEVLDNHKVERVFQTPRVLNTAGERTWDGTARESCAFVKVIPMSFGINQGIRIDALTFRYAEDIYNHYDEPEISKFKICVARIPYNWAANSKGTPYEVVCESKVLPHSPKGTYADGETYRVEMVQKGNSDRRRVIDPQDRIVIYAQGADARGSWKLYPLQVAKFHTTGSGPDMGFGIYGTDCGDPSKAYDEETNQLVSHPNIDGVVDMVFEYTEEVLLRDLATRLETLETGGVSEERLVEAIEQEASQRAQMDSTLIASINSKADYDHAHTFETLAVVQEDDDGLFVNREMWDGTNFNFIAGKNLCEASPGSALFVEDYKVGAYLDYDRYEFTPGMFGVTTTPPVATDNANCYGYRGTLKNLGAKGDGILVTRISILTRASNNQNTGTPLWARILKRAKGSYDWAVVAQSPHSRTWGNVPAGSELSWEMTYTGDVDLPSADEEVAIVWVNSETAAANRSDGSLSFQTVDLKGGLQYALPSNAGTSSNLASWSPRITLTYHAYSIQVDQALSATSTRPVQNKVLYSALNNKQDRDATLARMSVSSTPPDWYNDVLIDGAKRLMFYNNNVESMLLQSKDGEGAISWYTGYGITTLPLGGSTKGLETWADDGTAGIDPSKTFVGVDASHVFHANGQIHGAQMLSADTNKRLYVPFDLMQNDEERWLSAASVWNGNRNIIFNGDTTTLVQPLVPTNKGDNAAYVPYALPCFEDSPMFWKGQMIWHDGTTTLSKSVSIPWSRVTGTTASPSELALKSDIPSIDATLSTTSTNPVQNQAVKSALDGKADAQHTHALVERSAHAIAWLEGTSLLTVTPNADGAVVFDPTGWPEGQSLLVRLTTPEDFGGVPASVRLVGYFDLEPASTYQLTAYVVGGVMHLVPLVKED